MLRGIDRCSKKNEKRCQLQRCDYDGEKKKVLGKIDNKPSSNYRLFHLTVAIVNMHPQKHWIKNCVRCNGNVSSSRASMHHLQMFSIGFQWLPEWKSGRNNKQQQNPFFNYP